MRPFLLVVLVLLSSSTSAVAQTEALSVFVTGSFFSGIERVSHRDTIEPVSFKVDLSGTTIGGSVAVGTFLSPRWSVRLELAFPSTLDTNFSPPAFPGAPPPPFTQRVHIDYRTRTGAVLLGYHTPRRHRVSVEYVGGIAFIQGRQRQVTEFTLRAPIPSPPPPRIETVSVDYWGAATAGVDVDLAITSHFAVVPQIRAHVQVNPLVSALSIRPALGVRWRF